MDVMLLDLWEGGAIDGDDLRHAGNVLGRYRDNLERRGLSY